MKLSDFKDEAGVKVVAKLLVPIGRIATNKDNEKAANLSPLEFASAILRNNAAEVKTMFAILNDKDPEQYHCDGATVLIDTFSMLNDPPLMALFNLQSKISPSSGSASTIGGAEAEQKDS